MDANQLSPHYPPIRRVDSTRQDLIAKYNVKSFPTFVFLERSGKSVLYNIQPDREYMMKILRKFFDSESDGAVPAVPKPSHTSVQEPSQISRHTNFKAAKDQVYMADLEGALLYAFGHEVSIHKVIAGKELAALKTFVKVLDEYFPGLSEMKETIHTLRKSLEDKKQIRGEEFEKIWHDALNGREKNQQWVGCHGSRPKFRGYPCSLWTTFHTLTVSFAQKHPDDSALEPNLVLQAMKGFIKYFFGCSHCSNHFVDMAEDEVNPIESVKSPRQAVLWLWAAHNKVKQKII